MLLSAIAISVILLLLILTCGPYILNTLLRFIKEWISTVQLMVLKQYQPVYLMIISRIWDDTTLKGNERARPSLTRPNSSLQANSPSKSNEQRKIYVQQPWIGGYQGNCTYWTQANPIVSQVNDQIRSKSEICPVLPKNRDL